MRKELPERGLPREASRRLGQVLPDSPGEVEASFGDRQKDERPGRQGLGERGQVEEGVRRDGGTRRGRKDPETPCRHLSNNPFPVSPERDPPGEDPVGDPRLHEPPDPVPIPTLISLHFFLPGSPRRSGFCLAPAPTVFHGFRRFLPCIMK